jgi:hypothetical protein
MSVPWRSRGVGLTAILIAAGCASRSSAIADAGAASGDRESGAPSGGSAALDGSTVDGGEGDDDGGLVAAEDASSAATDAGCASAAPLTQSDPHNCGSIGNDCVGGACEDGGCAPLPAGVLATGQLSPVAMAADDTNVYWLNWGVTQQLSTPGGGLPVEENVGAQVLECAVTGCDNRPTVLASIDGAGGIPHAPSALAIDANNVYWTTSTSVQSCGIAGCGCAPKTIASGLSQPPALTVAGGRVYWSVWANGSPFTGQIESCPSGGCASAPALLAGALGGPLGLAVDTTDVYWVNTYASGSLMECALGGCDAGPTTLWSADGGATQSTAVVVDATNLYWTNGGQGTVMQCAKANCASTVIALASGQANPSGIAIDPGFVYWRTSNVYRCAIGGCGNSPDLVATAPFTGFQWDAPLAANSTHVFWVQNGATATDARIMTGAR